MRYGLTTRKTPILGANPYRTLDQARIQGVRYGLAPASHPEPPMHPSSRTRYSSLLRETSHRPTLISTVLQHRGCCTEREDNMHTKTHFRLRRILVALVAGVLVTAGLAAVPETAQAGSPAYPCWPIVSYLPAESGTVGTVNVRVTNTCSVAGPIKVVLSCPTMGMWWWVSLRSWESRTVLIMNKRDIAGGCYVRAYAL